MLSLINGSLLKQSPVSKHTLKQVFELFCDTRADWSAKTLAKQRKIFHSKLSHLADKDISLIKREDILIILDQIFNQGKYSALKDTYSLIQRVFAFAKARNICDNPFGGLGLSSFYHTPKSLGHSWINSVEDLRHLIKFIMRYPHSPSVKYALTLGLITGLRSSNVRYLNISQLNIDELRLFFPAKGNKSIGKSIFIAFN